MALPVEVNPLFLENQYAIQRSLRFRASATAYLSKTFVNGNSKKYTFSAWIKRGTIGAIDQGIIWANSGGFATEQTGFLFSNDTIRYFNVVSGITNTNMITTQVFRDCSSWYHILFIFDSGNATFTDRYQLWINGARVTAFSTATYPPLNQDTYMNLAFPHTMARSAQAASSYFDGYMAEVNFIDGQALTPSSFGQYNEFGVWSPRKYGGAYGTTGFYLPFTNTTSTTTLVADSSGLGNNWTPNNISLTAGATYDAMTDVPAPSTIQNVVAGNYATLNPLWTGTAIGTFSNGNLTYTQSSAANTSAIATFAVSSGKWYFETTLTTLQAGSDPLIGMITPSAQTPTTGYPGYLSSSYSAYNLTSNTFLQKVNNGVFTNTNQTVAVAGNIINVAVDMDNGRIWFGKNGTWCDSGDPAAGTNAQFTGLTGTLAPALRGAGGAGLNCSLDVNFGQRPFAYAVPSGFLPLNSNNLPTPTIPNGATVMAAVAYAGAGGTSTVTTSSTNSGNNPLGTTFQPDFVWIKNRNAAYSHLLYDVIRTAGQNKALMSNTTYGEGGNPASDNSTYGYLNSFNANGITVVQGSDATSYTNGPTSSYIAWQWKAGGTPTINNTAGAGNVPTAGSVLINGANSTSALAGSIAATRISANTSAGFSVVTYTGTGANATVGHELGVAPDMVIIKRRDTTSNWQVRHTSIAVANSIQLNLTNAAASATTVWNSTAPTPTVFSIGTDATVNANTGTYVAYCFDAVAGYSAFGSYTGNGSNDGPFVYTGFRPRYILFKRTDSTGNWYIYDSSRQTYNVMQLELYPDVSAAETNGGDTVDLLSNGFKLRTGAQAPKNANGGTFIYMAFAENPFKLALAR